MNGVGKSSGLHCAGVSKTYRDGYRHVCVLDNIDFDVASGELTFVVGPSGCGKSTLLAIAAGILEADCGAVAYRARPEKHRHHKKREPGDKRHQPRCRIEQTRHVEAH